MRNVLLIALSIFVFPSIAAAGVVINEVDWMGDDASANNEWIELYNNGSSPVVVDGWTLSDGVNLTIPLSGTIVDGAYPVLERTDDQSAPGTAFLIYTGSLPNTGATLILTDTNGTVVDRVVGGVDWQNIGGDNTTKETAQRTAAGWVTGPATPGAHNVQTSTPHVTSSSADAHSAPSTAVVRSVGTRAVSTLDPHPPALVVSIDGVSDGVVDQPLTFTAASTGPVKLVRQSVVYTWNFGDLTTATGTTATHRYRHPGTYAVTLYGNYRGLYTATTRKTVTVLPVRLSLMYQNQTLQLNNDAPYEIDLSGYRLISGKATAFPARSILLPYATLTVPADSYTVSGLVELQDANGMRVATTTTVAQSPSTELSLAAVSTQRPTRPLVKNQ